MPLCSVTTWLIKGKSQGTSGLAGASSSAKRSESSPAKAEQDHQSSQSGREEKIMESTSSQSNLNMPEEKLESAELKPVYEKSMETKLSNLGAKIDEIV